MIILALSCSREQWLLNRYLEWSLNSTLVRKQDVTILFSGVAHQEIGYHLARNFFFDRIDDIHETWEFCNQTFYVFSNICFNRLYPDTSRLSRYVKPLADQMSSEKDLRELKDLVTSKQKTFEKATLGVKQALETIELNNQWKISMYKDLSRRLNTMLLRNFVYTLDDDDDDDDEPKALTTPIWYIFLVPLKFDFLADSRWLKWNRWIT